MMYVLIQADWIVISWSFRRQGGPLAPLFYWDNVKKWNVKVDKYIRTIITLGILHRIWTLMIKYQDFITRAISMEDNQNSDVKDARKMIFRWLSDKYLIIHCFLVLKGTSQNFYFTRNPYTLFFIRKLVEFLVLEF